jgi:high-affinity nickel-transport protein
VLSLFSVVALGFFLGMRHATDADHVVAVMTIVSRQRSLKPAAWVGALWGVGHTLTIAAVGSAIILFNWVVSPRVGLTMELAVGVMLILLGVLNVTGTMRDVGAPNADGHVHVEPVHSHAHAHGDYVHTHPHAHEPERHPHTPDTTPVATLDRWFSGVSGYQLLRPLVIGIVHGLAGSAAVALLVLSTIHDTTWAIAYLLVFGVGTIAGMMIITTLVAVPFAVTSRQFASTNRRLQIATGVLSLAFGLFVAYQIGIVDGLFTGDMHWTPR